MNLVVNVGLLVSAEYPFEICGQTFKVVAVSMVLSAFRQKVEFDLDCGFAR